MGGLRAEVDEVAAEKKVVLGRNGHGVAHEGRRVTAEGKSHWTGDTVIALVSFPTLRTIYEMRQILSRVEAVRRDAGIGAYISGSFCVSITAAIGIPKLDAGPQKSV